MMWDATAVIRQIKRRPGGKAAERGRGMKVERRAERERAMVRKIVRQTGSTTQISRGREGGRERARMGGRGDVLISCIAVVVWP